jgi:hypothetical protein
MKTSSSPRILSYNKMLCLLAFLHPYLQGEKDAEVQFSYKDILRSFLKPKDRLSPLKEECIKQAKRNNPKIKTAAT